MDANEYICQDFEKDRIIEDYSFEVFWKDDITASVNVHGDKVRVTRYVMTRYQLNRILEMRCWDRRREDIDEILVHLGLKEYNPYEIVRKTHGVSWNDYIWFRFPGEKLTSRDVLVRD